MGQKLFSLKTQGVVYIGIYRRAVNCVKYGIYRKVILFITSTSWTLCHVTSPTKSQKMTAV